MDKSLEAILFEISQSPEIDSGDLKTAGSLIIQACCKGLDISRTSMWSVDESGAKCHLLIDNGEFQTFDNFFLSRQAFPIYFQNLDNERIIAAADAVNDKITFEFSEVYLKPRNIASMLDVPIRRKGKMIDIICCEHQGEHLKHWQDDELIFVSTLAELYGRANNAHRSLQYEEALRDLNAELDSIVKKRTKELEATIFELKQAQEELAESKKLAALGEMVAGIAHEVNTPLGVAITAASLCAEKMSAVSINLENKTLTRPMLSDFLSDSSDALKIVLANLDRSAHLMNDFRNVSANQINPTREKVIIEEYIGQVLNTLSPKLKKHKVQVEYHIASCHERLTYPGLLAQVISNLVNNAIEHAFKADQPEKKLEVLVEKSMDHINIHFNDNGKGISEQHLAHIFNPFFTTKRHDGNTGLGLSISYNLLKKQLGGSLSVSSKEGVGSQFTISLPDILFNRGCAENVSCEPQTTS
ncbi:histidine kinase [Pseudoalteromonas phenolica]|uniref:histidine kinase n=1 Tax=Pseudoalteromonas phenolica TaxID=161398 RepID=A0A5R9Q738_9GAMM|nr:GAF domain-containing sensor histidine kinase [Pseudoalteromonas phenolica]TLX48958.1 histidine kinase [Pseudoalteromonas phenolica]